MVVAFDRGRQPELVTTAEAAEIAHVHPATIRRWCRTGMLGSFSIGGPGDRRHRVRRTDLLRLLARRSGAEGGGSERSGAAPDRITRADALRRIAADISGKLDLEILFEDVVEYSTTLFATDRVGLWLVNDGPNPLELAAERDLGDRLRAVAAGVSSGDRDSAALRAIRERSIVVLSDPARQGTSQEIREAHAAEGIGTLCFVPIIFQNQPLGLLALYHHARHPWPDEELELARGFADQLATAIQNARLYESVSGMAERLGAIQDLSLRLNRIHDTQAIGEAIVIETGRLIEFDTIRVYIVDRAAGMCEPIAFQGEFMGVRNPTPDMLRVPIGTGLTGWCAEHNEPIVVGNAAEDPRGLQVGRPLGVESLLVVPMSYEDRVHGVIVCSKLGRNRFGSDDQMILSIFAGYAAQALVNGDYFARLTEQRRELEHQLASQRRLLEVNETLLSTLEPRAVLEMIADALRAVVEYDALSIYQVDRAAGVRRAVVARDLFADVILEYVGPLGVGLTGWAVEHNEPVLANEAHLDPRAVQIPGTPFEPEAMIVVPLAVRGAVIGTLNLSRMGTDARFTDNEFELTKLFAGQASLALQNAEAHRAAKLRAEHDSLTGLRNHGAFQRDLGELVAAGRTGRCAILMMDLDRFKDFNDTRGHPAGDSLLRAVGETIVANIRDVDRAYRYGGDEFAVILGEAVRLEAHEIARRIASAVAALPSKPPITISVGVACHPDDGRTKDDLVAAADAALYLAKPSHGSDATRQSMEAYLAALNETALLLMDRLDEQELLETIIARASSLMGTPHGFIYLADPDGAWLTVRAGTGLFADLIGYRLRSGEGLSGRIHASGRPFAVEAYAAFAGRARDLPVERFGAVVGVPLRARSNVVGVIGLASGSVDRTFGEREIGVLRRFGQLASIALENARLFDAAQREVVERGRVEAALRVSEERFRRLSDATSEALAIHRGGRILEVNQAFCKLFGYRPDEVVGRQVLDLIAPESKRVAARLVRSRPASRLEVAALDRSGTSFPVEISGRTIPYTDGRPARVASIHDLRERRELEDRLARQALYDTLTGLPNRDLLMDRLAHALSWIHSSDMEPLGVILLDLDRFKLINESLGHAVGDELLKVVGQRLSEVVRPADTVARFAGDQFAVLLERVRNQDEARAIADRIHDALSTPFELRGRPGFVTASIGIVLGHPGESSPEDLLREAEIALHHAKADSTIRHAVFEPGMSQASLERLDLENDLRRAIEQRELVVHYQPLVDLATDRIVGLEALVRWQHPQRGLVPPMAFIPLAEETGLILPLGRWVLETACRETRGWQRTFAAEPPLQISVNLSARQFAQIDLVEQVEAILADTGLAPETLELEITESVVMDQTEAGTLALHALRGLGVRLVLDDFGTGYSSLSYLKTLPLDTIKIDRSFVAELGSDGANLPIVRAVISLAHGLGIDVTAEGIETAEQLQLLRDLVCDRGQGYYYARPLPAAELERLLASRQQGRPLPMPDEATRVSIRSTGRAGAA